MKKIALVLVLLIGAWVFFQAGPGEMPKDLGVTNQKLKDCPSSPNCVSTQATDADHQMDALDFKGDLASTKQQIMKIMGATARMELKSEATYYLHYVATSKLMKFADDVEFFFDHQNQKVHFRSASRKGYSDLGVNKKRMEKIVNAY